MPGLDPREQQIRDIMRRRGCLLRAKHDHQMSMLRCQEAQEDFQMAEAKLQQARDEFETVIAAWDIDDYLQAIEKVINAGT